MARPFTPAQTSKSWGHAGPFFLEAGSVLDASKIADPSGDLPAVKLAAVKEAPVLQPARCAQALPLARKSASDVNPATEQSAPVAFTRKGRCVGGC